MIKNYEANDRNGNIDVIRIFAMCLVILCHSIEGSFFDAPHSELIYNIGVCLHTLSRLGVPIFLILTGYLLLPRTWDKKGISNFYKKNLIGLIISFQILIIINFILKPKIIGEGYLRDYKEFFKQLFFLSQDPDNVLLQDWYMFFIIPFYLFIPIISMGLKKINIKYVLVIILFIYFYYYCFHPIIYKAIFNIYLILYVFIGYLIDYINKLFINYKIKNSIIKLISFIEILLFIIIFIVTLYYQVKIYSSTVWYDSVFLPPLAFLLVHSLTNLIKVKARKTLIMISNVSFGVYLYHIYFAMLFNNIINLNVNYKFIVVFSLTLISSLIITLAVSFIPFVGTLFIRTNNLKLFYKSKKEKLLNKL